MFTKGFCIDEKAEIEMFVRNLANLFGVPIGGSVKKILPGISEVTIKFLKEGHEPVNYKFFRQRCRICNLPSRYDQCISCTEEKFYGVP